MAGAGALFRTVAMFANLFFTGLSARDAREAMTAQINRNRELFDMEKARLRQQLEADIGVLGAQRFEGGEFDYGSYSDWLAEQQQEFAEYNGTLSWDDYLEEQQMAELGQLGLQIKDFEDYVTETRKDIEDARTDSEQARAGGLFESQQQAVGDLASAAASGVISGGAVAGTQVSQEARDLAIIETYNDRLRDIGDTEDALESDIQTNFGGEGYEGAFSQAITNARNAWDSQIDSLRFAMDAQNAALRDAYAQNYGVDDFFRAALEGWQIGASLADSANEAGIINLNDDWFGDWVTRFSS